MAGGYWEDVGTLEAYLRAHADILDGKVEMDMPGFSLRPNVWLGAGAEIHPSAKVVGPALIGDNCRIGAGVELHGYCVLGANVRIGENTVIERCVIHDNVYIASSVNARGCVIARSCDIRQGAHLDDGVVLGAGSKVGRQAVIGAGVKVYPHKIIEAGAVVNSSIIWESRGSRSLFGRLGVAGIANVDLSPEVALRVALAYASTLPKGATVAISRDSSRAARMLKRAAIVGIIAAGCNVEDLEAATVPVTRFLTRTGRAVGGMTVRLVPGDPQSVVLRFLNDEGMDLGEAAQRKIERLYDREESRRVLAAEIGDISFASRTLELYTNELTNLVDIDAIRAGEVQVGPRLRVRNGELRHAQRAREARSRHSWDQPECLDCRSDRLRQGGARGTAGRACAIVRRKPRGDVGSRWGAAHPRGRHRPRARGRRGSPRARPACIHGGA